MTYFEIYILIPLLAITIDWLHTVLRLPQVVIFGTTAEPLPVTEPKATKADDLYVRTREYVCAIHNEGDRVFEDPKHPVLVRLEVLGDGMFMPEGCVGFVGPNRDIVARWADAGPKHKRLQLEIARLRPWKTLFFRVKVPAGSTYEVRMKVLVPGKTWFRSILERVNEHQYGYSRLGYSSASIVVKSGPVRRALLGGWKGWLQISLPMLFIMGFFYRVFWNVLLVPLRERATDPMSGVTWVAYYQPPWVYVDLCGVVLGMTLLFLLFREKGRPLVSGYRGPKEVEIGEFKEVPRRVD